MSVATHLVALALLICSVAAGRAAEISSGSGVAIGGKGEVLKRSCRRRVPNDHGEARVGKFGTGRACRERRKERSRARPP